jgi:hypothetical protein
MHSQLHLLPQRFPVGTRYVVEERSGIRGLRIRSRYIEFPDGRHVDLPPEGSHAARPRAHSGVGEKNKFASSWNGRRPSEFSA